MAEFPAMSHVAVTVTDLAVSVPWYERLLGAKPVLDEDTGGFHHAVFPRPRQHRLGAVRAARIGQTTAHRQGPTSWARQFFGHIAYASLVARLSS
jgi:catechol 2,3-dioxygenase-like lactoylglutathione lyase family enzyme